MDVRRWTCQCVLMDITETWAARVGITSGANIALVGSWFLGLLRGQFAPRHPPVIAPPGKWAPAGRFTSSSAEAR